MDHERVDRAGERDNGDEARGPCSPGSRSFEAYPGEGIRLLLRAFVLDARNIKERASEMERLLGLILECDGKLDIYRGEAAKGGSRADASV